MTLRLNVPLSNLAYRAEPQSAEYPVISSDFTGKMAPEDIENMEYDVEVAPADDNKRNEPEQIKLF